MQHSQTTLIWNTPLRLFHWGLVCCFIIAWSTRDSRYLDIHIFSGYCALSLTLFRLLWGGIGGPYARFADSSYSWREVLKHLQESLMGQPKRFIGHNPAGSWAIFILISLTLAITFSGIITLGGEEQHGPLAGLLSFEQGDATHQIHQLLAWLTVGMITLHVTAVLVESRLLRESLIGAMITGRKQTTPKVQAATPHHKTALALSIILASTTLFWFWGYLAAPKGQPYRPFIGPELVDDPLWREECGSCHLAFHPTLLPARSWQKMMDEQASHFEEDLFLEPETIDTLTHFLINNSAEGAATEAAWQINRSIPLDESPIAITHTPYWKERHNELPDAIWQSESVKSRSDCAACHLDADLGTFEDGAMHIPSNF